MLRIDSKPLIKRITLPIIITGNKVPPNASPVLRRAAGSGPAARFLNQVISSGSLPAFTCALCVDEMCSTKVSLGPAIGGQEKSRPISIV